MRPGYWTCCENRVNGTHGSVTQMRLESQALSVVGLDQHTVTHLFKAHPVVADDEQVSATENGDAEGRAPSPTPTYDGGASTPPTLAANATSPGRQPAGRP